MSEEQEVQTPEVAPEILTEAHEGGWVPQDQWRGPPEQWIDAEKFVNKGRQIQVVLNKKLAVEREASRKQAAEIAELRQTVSGLADYRAKLEKTIYEQAMKDLKANLRQAREVGDMETAAALEEQVDDLKSNPPKVEQQAATQPAPAGMHPDVAAWMSANPWYDEAKNPEMSEYANGVTMTALNQAKAKGVQVNLPDLLAGVTAKVKKMFPEKFSTGAPSSMFEGGGRGNSPAGVGGGKTFASLPPDAKKEFDRFWKSDFYRGMTKEAAQSEYHKVYTEG